MNDAGQPVPFHLGQNIAWDSTSRVTAFIAGTQSGKALWVETPIMTGLGFKRMGDIQVGDTVYGSDGNLCNVTYVSPVFYGNRCFSVMFDDGSNIVADAGHLWSVLPHSYRKNSVRSKNEKWTIPVVITTKEIYDNIGNNYSIPISAPYAGQEQKFEVPPYTLGAWLSDRNKNNPIYSDDDELKTHLASIGVLSKRRIPDEYFYCSTEQRLELLNGIMDADGLCRKDGSFRLSLSDKWLAYDCLKLMRSLGIKARLSKTKTRCYIGGRTGLPIFSVSDKKARLIHSVRRNTKVRYIKSVCEINSFPTMCIAVDSKDSLYLAGQDFILTHNTSFGPWWLAREIEKGEGGDFLAVTASFDLFKLKMLPTMLTVFQDILKIGRYWAGDKVIEICNPSGKFIARQSTDKMWGRIVLRSADAIGGLESATAKAAWLDECGQDRFTIDAYKAIRRRLMLYKGPMLMTTTLYNLGWLVSTIIDPTVRSGKTEYLSENDGEIEVTRSEKTDITLVQVDSIVNPVVSRKEYEEAKELSTPEEFDMFYRGRKSSRRFLIYDSFDSMKCVVDEFLIPPTWKRYLGIDFGGVHMCGMFYAEDPQTNILYAYAEYLQPYRSIKEHVIELKNIEPHIFLAVGGAAAEGQWRTEFSFHGLQVLRPDISDVNLGINRVWSVHKQNGIIYFKNLRGILDEKGRYRRKRDNRGVVQEDIESKSTFHYCLSGDTMVRTIDGEVPISQIKPGVFILTRCGYQLVTDAMQTGVKPTFKVTLSNGRVLIGTEDHPVFVKNAHRFVPISDLQEGDLFLNYTKTGKNEVETEVSFVNREPFETLPVYNLVVNHRHEYYANGILVHNCDAERYIVSYIRPGTPMNATVIALGGESNG